MSSSPSSLSLDLLRLSGVKVADIPLFPRGCVSGAQVQNMRDAIGDGAGSYDWDRIDGYDELE